jgi:hypothetical protein
MENQPPTSTGEIKNTAAIAVVEASRDGSDSLPWPRRKAIADTFNAWFQILAIIAAGGFSYYTFIYKEKTMPHSEAGHVSGKAELCFVASKGTYRAVQASIYIKNNSKKSVKLLAGLVEVVGYRFVGNIQR